MLYFNALFINFIYNFNYQHLICPILKTDNIRTLKILLSMFSIISYNVLLHQICLNRPSYHIGHHIG